MIEIHPRKGQPIEIAIRLFNQKVRREGILEDCMSKTWHKKRSDKKRAKRLKAQKRKSEECGF